MAEKTGKIKTVAKTGGIIFENEEGWYNPTKICKQYVLPEYKNKEVTIKISDKNEHEFFHISLVQKGGDCLSPKSDTKDDYWVRREQRDVQTQKKITRAGALNTAVALLELSEKVGASQFRSAGGAPSDLLSTAFAVADEIVKWIEKQ